MGSQTGSFHQKEGEDVLIEYTWATIHMKILKKSLNVSSNETKCCLDTNSNPSRPHSRAPSEDEKEDKARSYILNKILGTGSTNEL